MDLAQPFCLNDWLVDPTLDEISRHGAVIRIEPRQMQVLLLLVRHAGEIVSLQSIEATVWAEEIVSPNSLHRAISQLRLALGDDAKVPKFIETVARRGYRLIASVEARVPPTKPCQPVPAEVMAPVVASAIGTCATSSTLDESSDPIPTTIEERPRSTVPRSVVLLGVASLILIVAGIVWESIESQRAAAARDRADQLAHFMVNMFSRDASTARGPTAAELADYAVQRVSTDLPQQHEMRAKMYEAIAVSYINSGFPGRAVTPLQQALEIRRESGQEANVAELLACLGRAYFHLSRYDESESAYREVLEIYRVTKGESSWEYASTMAELGELEVYRNQTDSALRLLDESLIRMRTVLGPHHSKVADILTTISGAHLHKGDLGQAERAVREAIRIYTHSRPELDPARVWADGFLGDILFFQGRLDEAAKILERARDAHMQLHGARSVQFAGTLEKLGDVYFRQGRVADSEKAKAEAIAILEGLGDGSSKGNETLASTKQSLAIQLLELGRASRAEQLLRETIDLYAQSTAPSPAADHFLAEALLVQGRFEEAESFARSAIDMYSKGGYVPWFTERSKSTLGEILYRQGQKAEGKQLILESHQRLSSDAYARPEAKSKARQRVRLVSAISH